MDLVDEILNFSSTLQKQEDDPLRDGLRFCLVEDALTPPAYDDTESNTTVDGIERVDTYKPATQRDSVDKVDPGTPSSQATVSNRVHVEGWPAQRKELELELERLIGWKYDVLNQNVDSMFKDSNSLHTMIRRSLVNIAQILVGLLRAELTSPKAPLRKPYQNLQNKMEEYRIMNDSRPLDEEDRIYHRTRSRQSSIGESNDDGDVLGNLRDNIDRVEYVLRGVVIMNTTTTSLGKRARRESSLDGQLDRKKLYNGPNLVPQMCEELEDDLLVLDRIIADMKALWETIDTTVINSERYGEKFCGGVTTTLTLTEQDGHVSAVLDFPAGHDNSITHLRFSYHVALEKLGLTSTDNVFQQNKAIYLFQEPVGICSCASSRYLAAAIRSGLDVVSLAVNVVTIVETVIKLLAALQRAQERQNDLPKLLAVHSKELQNTKQIVNIVLSEEALHIDTIVSDLTDIDGYGTKLKDCLVKLAKERTAFQQYTHQLLKGSKNIAKLSGIMSGLNLAKGSLILKIQVAHVGLTRAYGNAVLVNCEIVERVNTLLQQILGEGEGLRIADLLRNGIPQADGKIRLNYNDLHMAGLWDDDEATIADDDEFQDRVTSLGTSRVVVDNESSDSALMVNAPIDDPEVDHLTISKNRARGNSIMINNRITTKHFDRLVVIQEKRLKLQH
ncbi:hypothetical protein VMCG_05338 [Cytospora schulzeri]|uniref:Uncharacterized protein n=1 Tax=Cytospora schulzeri TaxID=448051 RepID=A0A423WK06_9PEZI|nr:hypothetical protein VMCG_05338 [Valsa malicola]